MCRQEIYSPDEVRGVLGEDDVRPEWEDVVGGHLAVLTLQFCGLNNDLSGVCCGKHLITAGTELGRTAPRSVFVEKFLLLSPKSGVNIGAEHE